MANNRMHESTAKTQRTQGNTKECPSFPDGRVRFGFHFGYGLHELQSPLKELGNFIVNLVGFGTDFFETCHFIIIQQKSPGAERHSAQSPVGHVLRPGATALVNFCRRLRPRSLAFSCFRLPLLSPCYRAPHRVRRLTLIHFKKPTVGSAIADSEFYRTRALWATPLVGGALFVRVNPHVNVATVKLYADKLSLRFLLRRWL